MLISNRYVIKKKLEIDNIKNNNFIYVGTGIKRNAILRLTHKVDSLQKFIN